jgi:hypothetical protein
MQVLDHGIQVKAPEFFRVVEPLPHGIGLWGMLVQNLKVHLIRPPVNVRIRAASAMPYGALRFGCGVFLFSLWDNTT